MKPKSGSKIVISKSDLYVETELADDVDRNKAILDRRRTRRRRALDKKRDEDPKRFIDDYWGDL